jgi:hypothetical protein
MIPSNISAGIHLVQAVGGIYFVILVLMRGVEISTVASAGARISMQPEKESQLQYHVPRDPLLIKESIAYNRNPQDGIPPIMSICGIPACRIPSRIPTSSKWTLLALHRRAQASSLVLDTKNDRSTDQHHKILRPLASSACPPAFLRRNFWHLPQLAPEGQHLAPRLRSIACLQVTLSSSV